MGTDIRVHIEQKIDGCWHRLHHQRVDRWYALFGKLGYPFRHEETPIVERRGIPIDATPAVFKDASESSVFHPTWLNRTELLLLDDWLREKGVKFEDEFEDIQGHPLLETEDIRFIIWFDQP